MAYLDLSPMLQAIRARPSEFEMLGSYLRHKSSHHLVNFDIWGNARVHARCDCAMLDVTREQSEEMKAAIAAWKVVYWEPYVARLAAEKRVAQINREFASHFRSPGLWQRIAAVFRSARTASFALTIEDAGGLVPGQAPPEQSAAQPPTARARRELLPN